MGQKANKSYIMARRTSLMGMTPSFSPCIASQNRLKASLISASSSPVMLFSLASLDWRAFGAADDDSAAAAGARRLAGYDAQGTVSKIPDAPGSESGRRDVPSRRPAGGVSCLVVGSELQFES